MLYVYISLAIVANGIVPPVNIPVILFVPAHRVVPVILAFWSFKSFQVNPIKLRTVCCKLLIQLKH